MRKALDLFQEKSASDPSGRVEFYLAKTADGKMSVGLVFGNDPKIAILLKWSNMRSRKAARVIGAMRSGKIGMHQIMQSPYFLIDRKVKNDE